MTQEKKTENTSNNNPYLNGTRTWNDFISGQVAQRKMWQVTALTSLMCVMLCIMGVIYIGSQSKITPYIVEVDSLGRSQFMGVIPTYENIDQRVINVILTDFISDYRTVSSDVDLGIKFINRLFAKLDPSDTAHTKIAEQFSKKNPIEEGKSKTVDVKVTAILQISPQSYAIEWTETTRDRSRSGKITDIGKYKSIVTVKNTDTSNMSFEQLQNNPVGLYITDFSLQRLNENK
ncbi:VirB8/TrbF family protein [Ruminobacter sp. RM87]|uniref:VirB8/TrbF family protein n=1 Tax=Ruminobacter sp. RM87 TaxID=1200567 RepID=UPI0004E176CB|nr:VirB8/TrbF family protein [Ruminobacter sp. RM87]